MKKELIKNLDTFDYSRENAEHALHILKDHYHIDITHKQGEDLSVCLVEEEIGNWPWVDRGVFIRGTWFDIEHSETGDDKPVFYITANEERVFNVGNDYGKAVEALRNIYELNSEHKLPDVITEACLHEGEYYKLDHVKEILINFKSIHEQMTTFVKGIEFALMQKGYDND